MEYLKKVSQNLNKELINSSLAITATIHIRKTEIQSSSFNELLNTTLDPVGSQKPKYTLPLDLSEHYRVKCIPIEYHTLRLDVYKKIHYNSSSKYEPYDVWLIIKKSDIKINENSTYLDYSDTISLKGDTYNITGKFEDLDDFVHTFLVKKS